MAGGKSPRQKGDRFERQLVHLFQDHGIAAERIPLSGASPFGTMSGYDLNIPLFGADYRVECKHSGDGFKTLYKWLDHGKNHFLIVRADHSEPLAVIPVSELLEMARTSRPVGYSQVPKVVYAKEVDQSFVKTKKAKPLLVGYSKKK